MVPPKRVQAPTLADVLNTHIKHGSSRIVVLLFRFDNYVVNRKSEDATDNKIYGRSVDQSIEAWLQSVIQAA